MQSVAYPLCNRNTTALNIINIVDQLLRVTESGRLCMGCLTYSSPCGSPVAVKLQWGTFLRKE